MPFCKETQLFWTHFSRWPWVTDPDPGSCTLQSPSIDTLPEEKCNFPCCISFEEECSQYGLWAANTLSFEQWSFFLDYLCMPLQRYHGFPHKVSNKTWTDKWTNAQNQGLAVFSFARLWTAFAKQLFPSGHSMIDWMFLIDIPFRKIWLLKVKWLPMITTSTFIVKYFISS